MKKEHTLSCQVASFLRLSGYVVVDTDVMSGLRFLGNNQHSRVLYINDHKMMGYTKGQSDLVVLSPQGKTTFMELKNGKVGRQSDDQKLFQKDVEKRGGSYVIVRNMQDVADFVRKDRDYGNCCVPPCTQSLSSSHLYKEDI